ncbi:MAG: 1-acyl-sn-glycerol-3-phosphate acyltransferase [Clostridia bacterium]|nr:1-acyl-sn-glycerol-3-phosphate acyltransferase [Clostridia bacterium]
MSDLEIFSIILLSIVGVVLAYVICHVLTLVIMALCVDMKREYARTNKFYERFLNYTAWLILKFSNVKVVLRGREKIPTDTRFLYVANHLSNFDPIIVRAILGNYDINFISKPQNFKIPVLKQLIHRMKFLPIDRDNARSSLKTLNKAIEYVKNDEGSMGVYPEGMRSKSGDLLPFHDGVFKVAIKANVPVVVGCMIGQEKIKKRAPFRRTIVYFDILEVLPTKEKVSSHELSEKARTLIENKLNESKES